MSAVKDYTQRANVIKFLPWWIENMKLPGNGKEWAFNALNQHKTKFLNRKDELGLIQALGLKEK